MPGIELLLFLLALIGTGPSVGTPATAVEQVDFTKEIRPILEAKCQPCHFPGGKMHGKLPFDQPATVVTLGDKLFSRIRNEHSRAAIRRFLAEQKGR